MFTPVSQSGLVLIVDEDEIKRFFNKVMIFCLQISCCATLVAGFIRKHTLARQGAVLYTSYLY